MARNFSLKICIFFCLLSLLICKLDDDDDEGEGKETNQLCDELDGFALIEAQTSNAPYSSLVRGKDSEGKKGSSEKRDKQFGNFDFLYAKLKLEAGNWN